MNQFIASVEIAQENFENRTFNFSGRRD